MVESGEWGRVSLICLLSNRPGSGVVQTKVCPLLVHIEMNISSSNTGALLTHQNVKTGVSTVYRWSTREVLPEQVARHWDCTFVNRSSCYPGALLAHWKIKTGASHSTGPCKQVQL